MKLFHFNHCIRPAFGTLLMGVAMLTLPCSCSDDDKDTKTNTPPEDAAEYVADPTSDQVSATFSGLTAVIGTDLDDMGKAIVNRLAQTTDEITDGCKAVVLTPNTLKSGISAKQAAKMIKFYSTGGTIILVEPTDKNWENLEGVINSGLEQLEKEGYEIDGADNSLQLLQMIESNVASDSHKKNESDAVAFRNDEAYIVNELEEQAELSIENTSAIKDDEKGDTDTIGVVNGTEYNDYDVSDYRYGKSADLLINWMNQAEESAKSLQRGKEDMAMQLRASGASTDLTNYMNAQKLTIQKSVGPSRAFGRTMPYEIQYFIYGVYDFDHDEEYYFIRQHVSFHASQLYCTENKEKGWTKSPKGKKIRLDNGDVVTDEYFFGPYMRKSIITSYLEDITTETVDLYDPKPETTVGSQSHSSGFNWSINGSLGFAGNKPSGSISGGITFTSSYTVSESELKVIRTFDGKRRTSWTLEGIKPEVKYGFLSSNKHTLVGTFQTRDWSDDLTWYYRISHPSKTKTYSLYVQDYTEIAELNYSFHDYEIAVHPYQYHHVEMTPPVRFKQEWIMTCSNEALLNNVKSQLSDNWASNTTTYAVIESQLEENMSARFDKIKNSIAAVADVLVEQGYTGTYRFYVRKQGDSKNFKAFVLDNGKVSDLTD